MHCCCFWVSAMTSHWLLDIKAQCMIDPHLKAALLHTAKCQGMLHCCSHLSVNLPILYALSFLCFRDTVVSFLKICFPSLMAPFPPFFLVSFLGYWGWRECGRMLTHLFLPAWCQRVKEEMTGSFFSCYHHILRRKVVLLLRMHCTGGGKELRWSEYLLSFSWP